MHLMIHCYNFLCLILQVLLLRPQAEKEASVISIWHRLVNTLIENVINQPSSGLDPDNEGTFYYCKHGNL